MVVIFLDDFMAQPFVGLLEIGVFRTFQNPISILMRGHAPVDSQNPHRFRIRRDEFQEGLDGLLLQIRFFDSLAYGKGHGDFFVHAEFVPFFQLRKASRNQFGPLGQGVLIFGNRSVQVRIPP